MASISLQRVTKRYGRGEASHLALDGVSLDVARGEFVALLGPSGSGKTSLLRAIAGLERIDAGRIVIGDDCVADGAHHAAPEHRNVGVVFQNHALWPHLSVFENVAFPLREARLALPDITHRTMDALARVELDALAKRKPGELSGGQKQRVSLARALVARPRVILFDEPLASLDVELRRDMMRHISQLRSADSTMVYVTHNQEEALGLADRIAVLHAGRIEQLASPEVLCSEPATRRVAEFMGSGNLLPAVSSGVHGDRCIALLGDLRVAVRCHRATTAGEPLTLAVAPTDLVPVPDTAQGLRARVVQAFFQGHAHWSVDAELELPSGMQRVQLTQATRLPPRNGECLNLMVRNAWVIPQPAPE